MENNMERSCIDCHVLNCRRGEEGKYPDFCLTTHVPQEVQEQALDLLREPENNRIAVSAAEVEYEGYGKRTRVEEVIQFARKIGAHKLGIATCAGLAEESRILAKILRTNGFEVYAKWAPIQRWTLAFRKNVKPLASICAIRFCRRSPSMKPIPTSTSSWASALDTTAFLLNTPTPS